MVIGGSKNSGRANRGWRAEVLAQAETVRAEVVLAAPHSKLTVKDGRVTGGPEPAATVAGMVLECADQAEAYASESSTISRWLSGSHNEGAWTQLHNADELLIELMSPARLTSVVPRVVAACRILPAKDPQRRAVEAIARAVAKKPPAKLGDTARGVMRDALHSAYGQNEKRYQRARALRNKTLAMAAFLLLMTTVAIVVGLVNAPALPMCLPGEMGKVCPIDKAKPAAGDVALVAATGAAAAAVSAARALVGTTRRVGPYTTVAVQGALKIILGALLAVLGITLLRAGWVPGVDDVSSKSEILAWALLFGYAQQLLTGLLDQRAEKALEPAAQEEPVQASTDDDETVPAAAVDDSAAPPTDGDGSGDGGEAGGDAGAIVDESEVEAEPDAPPVEELDGANVVPDVPKPPRKPAKSAASGGSATPAARRRGAARGG